VPQKLARLARTTRRHGWPAWRHAAGLCVALSSAGTGLAAEAGHGGALAACAVELAKAVSVSFDPAENLFLSGDGTRYFAADLRFPDRAATGSGPSVQTGGASAEGYSAVALGAPNRWDMTPAWIVAEQTGTAHLWQARQLELGRAIFAPGFGTGPCAAALRRAESRARRAGAGIWQENGAVRIYSTDRPGLLEAAAGHYVIARGRIVSLGKTRRTRYLNFGKYWKTDVTGTLKTAEEELFSAALGGSAGTLDALAGRFVELRGVVELKDGPLITLRHPEQLVVLDD